MNNANSKIADEKANEISGRSCEEEVQFQFQLELNRAVRLVGWVFKLANCEQGGFYVEGLLAWVLSHQ